MPSCGRAFAAALALAVLAPALVAQAPDAAMAYEGLLARETDLRVELDASRSPAASAELLRFVRGMIANYETLSRKYPSSRYTDKALAQGALLAADAFARFGEPGDRDTARRLLGELTTRFPSSPLVARVRAQVMRVDDVPSAPPPVPSATVNVAASRGQTSRTEGTPSTLTAIKREVLPDAVRVTLALQQEATFTTEQLENPSRLSIDLLNTRVIYALKDARLTFASDIVRQVRVGSHEGDRTRVVIDLERAGRFSVYPIYNPYRLVLDFERASAAGSTSTVFAAAREPASPRGGPAPAVPPVAGTARGARNPGGGAAGTGAARAAAPRPSPSAPGAPSTNRDGGFSLSRQLGLGVARILIDAGHGGHDPGAKTAGVTEAELVLDVALELEKLLLKQAGVEVILTRRDNSYIPLEERTAMANRLGADLFLSIHANASSNRNARGVETYFLNFAQNAEAEAIAARENAGSTQTMRNLPDLVRTIALNNKIDESRDFATKVQSSLYAGLRKTNKQARNLGVKQAPFQVLIGATMPSILVEISFITNAQEGTLLKSGAYRTQIAQGLAEGIRKYRQSLTRRPAIASQ